ncbi:hypothetical protein [Halalkalibacterium ligniniphilum]|uniref:hypothetical protein n=1 Tax=Halalkalibacterium ligniniphilum TaxID=1134413 RepID=UPI0003493E8E|nr:hypothetical protein [Halalkalibacterium ligniniphilum]
MRIFIYLFIGCCFTFAFASEMHGRQNHETSPFIEDKIEVVPLQSIGVVSINTSEAKREMTVHHAVKGSDVYVECFINRFTLAKEQAGSPHKDGEGHLRLSINGKHVDTLYKAAFIIKGLPSGSHEVKIEAVKNDRSPYGMEETFTVTIP